MKKSAGSGTGEPDVLATFRKYFDAFMSGSIEEFAHYVSLPFFDARNGEIVEMRSEAQLEGFRRGLRARMSTLGIVSSTLERARVMTNHDGLALVQFENIRQDAKGSSKGGTQSLAFMRRSGGAPWRVWMISVQRVYENEGGQHD